MESGIARSGETIALAVPVDSLEEFVSSVQPYLAQSVFPSTKRISPLSQDIYPKFVWPSTDSLQHRPEESIEVQTLRTKAQFLADSMHNFIAVESFAWGSQDHEPVVESKYEVRVLDGYQLFREFPDGAKELVHVPLPPVAVSIVSVDKSECPDANFQRIQDAINAADDGAQIRICKGIYVEQLKIGTSLTIQADPGATLLSTQIQVNTTSLLDSSQIAAAILVKNTSFVSSTQRNGSKTPRQRAWRISFNLSAKDHPSCP